MNTVLGVIVILILTMIISAIPMILGMCGKVNVILFVIDEILNITATIFNVMLVVFLNIAIGWKILFIACFVIAFFSLRSAMAVMISGPFFINCMFPTAVSIALSEHFLPTAWIANKVYEWADIIHNTNTVAIFITCILLFAGCAVVNISDEMHDSLN